MKALHKQEGEEWLESHGWRDLSSKGLQNVLSLRKRYSIPIDSGKKTALARQLAGIFGNMPGYKLLLISDFSVWPSSENRALFDAYRHSLGENNFLHETPYHLLDDSDVLCLECLLDFVLYFFWDAVLVGSKADWALRVSHDEYLDIYFSTQLLDERLNIKI